ncbi:N-acetyltransferase [Ectothiorhodospiraceae bacterium WFHF3C12]|nr:N-acetyltransferase [Ectothiorhodospiraceae bacterium WFHF3C12]
MNIRESTTADLDAIEALHRRAFGHDEGPTVARLAVDLLRGESARPVLSLIAEEDGRIIGSIIFSAVKVDGHEGVSAHILAPLAVAPDHQGQGTGTALIASGLDTLRERGAEIVLVLGDPAYYTRAGFHTNHALAAPYPLEHPEGWLALELAPGALVRVKGAIHCAAALDAPEHW